MKLEKGRSGRHPVSWHDIFPNTQFLPLKGKKMRKKGKRKKQLNLWSLFRIPRNLNTTMSSTRRVMLYVLPVAFISVCLNIPKFMETEAVSSDSQAGGSNSTHIQASEMRLNPTYMLYYTISQIFHPTLTTGILPMAALIYMNTHIFLGKLWRVKILDRKDAQFSWNSIMAVPIWRGSYIFLFSLASLGRIVSETKGGRRHCCLQLVDWIFQSYQLLLPNNIFFNFPPLTTNIQCRRLLSKIEHYLSFLVALCRREAFCTF